ncbi:MAG: hypothetical protein H7338_08120 [Candidatus Sericytochromatia bacterium]|nr:hypothetical protein [Candidatus Sericytochromatia bacterium]
MAVAERLIERLDGAFAGRATAIARDLKLNLRMVLTKGALAPEEAASALVATAASIRETRLTQIGRDWLLDLEMGESQ